MRLWVALLSCPVTACGSGDPTLFVQSMHVEDRGDLLRFNIELYNGGPSKVWAQEGPFQIAPIDGGYLLALHNKEVGGRFATGSEDTIRSVEIDANHALLRGEPRATLSPALPRVGITPLEPSPRADPNAEVRYVDAERFVVQVAWYATDPSDVDIQTAPEPDGIVVAEWLVPRP